MGVDPESASASTDDDTAPEQDDRMRIDAKIETNRGGAPTTGPLLAELHPLVPGALEKLLVLLLAHLLPALLD
jgi:hypothetical protein